MRDELQQSAKEKWPSFIWKNFLGETPIRHFDLTTEENSKVRVIDCTTQENLDKKQLDHLRRVISKTIAKDIFVVLISDRETANYEAIFDWTYASHPMYLHAYFQDGSYDHLVYEDYNGVQKFSLRDFLNCVEEMDDTTFFDDWEAYGDRFPYDEKHCGLEFVKMPCWMCKGDIYCISGFVLPDRKVEDWQSYGWRYYEHIPLNECSPILAEKIAEYYKECKELQNLKIAQIEYRYVKAHKKKEHVAVCPLCNITISSFTVCSEHRMRHLCNPDPRKDKLLYKPATLKVDYLTMQNNGSGDASPYRADEYPGWVFGEKK